MLGLLLTTILTSAADSLNPIAVTQQFVLQRMVKKAKHIWFFIIPTGVTNLISGFLAYYGLLAFAESFFNAFIQKYGRIIFIAELILGIAFLVGVGFLLQKIRMDVLKKQVDVLKGNVQETDGSGEEKIARKIKSVSPPALVVLGIVATISELATALPYFAFLAVLFNYQLTFFQVSIVLVVYNLIYMMPLMILYFVYIKAQNKFDYLYGVINSKISKWSNILAPAVVGIIGVVLVYHSASLLLGM